jgi:hypothetical protein
MFKFKIVQIRKCSNSNLFKLKMFKFRNVQILNYSNLKLFRFEILLKFEIYSYSNFYENSKFV